MITLCYSKFDSDAAMIVERLRSLSLAFKSEIHAENESVNLIDDDLVMRGVDEITQHLDQLEKELHQWHYCNC